MANKPLQSIKFPDLPDTYTVPVVDSTLAVSGAAADAKQTGDSLADKVDKVSGKGLSTEDYTTEEKTKLADVETGATKTTIDSTLTVAGNAADAKAVGDAIANEDKKALAAFATDTASGSIASFPDGADDIPMKDVLIHIEPVQAGSGDPSPDNVRPITGWTAATISHSGADMTNPTTYSITFPTEAGTIYGGTLDVTKGELVVDRAIDIMDGTRIYDNGSLSYGGVQIRYVPLNQKKYGTQAEYNKGLISNLFRSTRLDKVECTVNGRPVNGYIYFNMPQAVTNVTLAQQWFADNLTQISYELATPITYHLTPQEITSLLGTNNLWADTGDSEVEYRADAKMYITKKITEAVSALS